MSTPSKNPMGAMMRRLLSTLILAVGLLTAWSASAQEIQLTGPLAGAPAVRHMRHYREGRFEIAPTASFSLLDEYRRTTRRARAVIERVFYE